MAKLSSNKRKKSLFSEEKSLVGLTPVFIQRTEERKKVVKVCKEDGRKKGHNLRPNVFFNFLHNIKSKTQSVELYGFFPCPALL